MRKMLLLTLSLALLVVPSALADRGGDHNGDKPGDRSPAAPGTAQPTPRGVPGGEHHGDKPGHRAPAAPGTAHPAPGTAATVIPAASPVACNRFTGKRVKFKVRGHVLSVGPGGIVVSIEKANGNFVKAAGATRSGGMYAAAPRTSNVAFIPFGDCTRVKRDGRARGEHGRHGPHFAQGSTCVQVGSRMVWHKRVGLICVGDRVQVEWKAPKNTIVATGLGAPNRIEVKGFH